MDFEFKSPGDIPLNVPFSQKEEAKSLGALWNGKNRTWFAPRGVNIVPLMGWLVEPSKSHLINMMAEEGFEIPKEEVQGMTLYQLLGMVKHAIQTNVQGAHWVKAEILSVNQGNHTYLELSDYGVDPRESAKTKGMIWSSNYQIMEAFKRHTGMELRSGIKVMLKVSVSYSELYGLSLEVLDIEHSFTLGDIEAQLQAIREMLRADGVFDLNRDMALPRDFTKVAVIAPANAAGLGDFRTQADVLHNSGLCEFDYFSATYQGANKDTDIQKAFTKILSKAKEYDAIVMIRGGGDKAGLYELNSHVLANLVCTSPIPVIVGIGHERDSCILDEVACLRCPTPSMVISHIAGTVVGNARTAIQQMKTIRQRMTEEINLARLTSQEMINRIRFDVGSQSNQAQAMLERMMDRLQAAQRASIEKARSDIRMLIKTVVLKNPQSILEQGYAVVRNDQNKMVTSADEAETSDQLTIQFKDNRITVKRGV